MITRGGGTAGGPRTGHVILLPNITHIFIFLASANHRILRSSFCSRSIPSSRFVLGALRFCCLVPVSVSYSGLVPVTILGSLLIRVQSCTFILFLLHLSSGFVPVTSIVWFVSCYNPLGSSHLYNASSCLFLLQSHMYCTLALFLLHPYPPVLFLLQCRCLILEL